MSIRIEARLECEACGKVHNGMMEVYLPLHGNDLKMETLPDNWSTVKIYGYGQAGYKVVVCSGSCADKVR